MSLKVKLNQIIKERSGEVFSLRELEDFCHKAGYKTATAERRLRPSESPLIQPVWNERRTAIIGYKYVNKEWWLEDIYKRKEINAEPQSQRQLI